MIAILLVIWVLYFFATGKYKKEYQEENNKKIKEGWLRFKSDIKKNTNSDVVNTEINTLRSFNKSKNICEIHYVDVGDNFSIRNIEIQYLVKDGRHWYVEAYCFDREDSRTFRFDRIEFLKCQQLNFNSYEKKEISKFLKDNFNT